MEENRMKNRKFVFFVVIFLAVAALAGLVIYDNVNRQFTDASYAMNTVVGVTLYGGDSEDANGIYSLISDLENNLISRMSESSELFRANDANAPFTISPETAEYLAKALDVCKKSGGALDITLGEITDLWGFSSGAEKIKTLPDSEALSQKLALCGFEKIVLDGDVLTVPSGVELDLGAVGKGIACDRVRKFLAATKIRKAVISVGGSVLLYGDKEFTVGVRDPKGTVSDYIAVLTLGEGCVSTSGSYERTVTVDGIDYHHILDRKTGYPVSNNIVSVTVVSDSGLLSDALSTACFVLGVESGMKLVEEYGCQAVFVTDNSEIHITDGLKGKISVKDANYTLCE